MSPNAVDYMDKHDSLFCCQHFDSAICSIVAVLTSVIDMLLGEEAASRHGGRARAAVDN